MLTELIEKHVKEMSGYALEAEWLTQKHTEIPRELESKPAMVSRKIGAKAIFLAVTLFAALGVSTQCIPEMLHGQIAESRQQSDYKQELKMFLMAKVVDLGTILLDTEVATDTAAAASTTANNEQHTISSVIVALQQQLRSYEIHSALEAAPGEHEKSASYQWPLAGSDAKSSHVDYPEHFPGIHIAAKPGTPVLSIAEGRVIHVEDSQNGYGILILVQHPQNVIAVYAKNQRSMVKVGDQVRKGDQLAETGATNLLKEPGLYLEIRHQGEAENPFLYLATL